MRKVMYRIYDCEKNQYLPGLYQDKDMIDAIGLPKGYAYTYSNTGNKYHGRYRIEPYGEINNMDTEWSREWDRVRISILNHKKK